MSVREGEKEKVKMKEKLQKIAGVLAVSSMFWFCIGCSCEIADSDKGQIKTIKDLRDGEIIVFSTDTVENMQFNPLSGDYSFNYVDTNGVRRTMTKALEPHFKEM